jgi:undecaprenyl-diphosphatase
VAIIWQYNPISLDLSTVQLVEREMQEIQAMDRAIVLWFQHHHGPLRDIIMIDLTTLGGHAVIVLVILFTIGLLVALRRYQTAVFVFLTAVAGAALLEGLKVAIGRERPSPDLIEHLIPEPYTASFPSGHSMFSAIVYPTLALVLSARISDRRVRAYLIAWSLGLTVLIGVSRVYLGVHYATDVLAGWSVGVLWAIAWRWVEMHWMRFRERAVDIGGEDAPPAVI